ncbi:hypothetical protein BDV27DRAFT_148118 [Aspergillus caelatus]|uniref:Fungal-specific transcription factor domain-containing protein n=1 Tax=Aspergillus caelatus TaxID=61420 RepID=A0A5N6ZVV9_9EURO|nr:uncharacterized protein BDV27DRAFT_148118 [Aspergillus caelatus]KAE8361086.1 hypothetical protein BDV27DRAFT_148118 [Aspergillus caelatus]
MHHFTLYTSKTLAKRKDMQDAWQIAFPRIAYSYEFLMHGILALSVFHLAHLTPERYSCYSTNSRLHISVGLRCFRKVILNSTVDNCSALFAFSSLIMVYMFATLSESAELKASDAIASILELFKLSSLRPLFRREFGMIQSSETELSGGLFEGFEKHLDRLGQPTETDVSGPEQKIACLQALECLGKSLRTIENSERPLELNESFIGLLREQHGVALVLLAFYCVQLHAFSDYWFVGPKGHSLLLKATDALAGQYVSWLEWPKGIISQST